MTTDQPKRRSVEPIAVRAAQAADRPFIVEMARLACVIEDCPLPDPTAPEVEAMLPGPDDCALVATGEGEVATGAAWWCFRDPALLLDESGAALPEMTLAVCEAYRNRRIGRALIEALAAEAAHRFSALALNVHIRNPAARLYSRTGFQVAGKGRGPLGVAMVRTLGADEPR